MTDHHPPDSSTPHKRGPVREVLSVGVSVFLFLAYVVPLAAGDRLDTGPGSTYTSWVRVALIPYLLLLAFTMARGFRASRAASGRRPDVRPEPASGDGHR